MTELLQVRGLRTEFLTEQGVVTSVEDVSFDIRPGETVGLVGESGSGKSVTALSIMRLLKTNGRIADGSIVFGGIDLRSASQDQMRRIRGNDLAMIFQEPMTSLNPVLKVGDQIAETMTLHLGIGRTEAWKRAVDLLDRVGIPRPAQIADDYPHRLSGGMRQRVMIAMALSCEPKLIIADEPTTALDVTIQAQILRLMRTLSAETGTALILITHDLGVVAEMADRVVVMYAGQVVEETDVYTLFDHPKHPYTHGLLGSIPHLTTPTGGRLESIPGSVPSPLAMPTGCRFADRCALHIERCDEPIELLPLESSVAHSVRCVRAGEVPDQPTTATTGRGE